MLHSSAVSNSLEEKALDASPPTNSTSRRQNTIEMNYYFKLIHVFLFNSHIVHEYRCASVFLSLTEDDVFEHLGCSINPRSPTSININNEFAWEWVVVRGESAHLTLFVTCRTYFRPLAVFLLIKCLGNTAQPSKPANTSPNKPQAANHQHNKSSLIFI